MDFPLLGTVAIVWIAAVVSYYVSCWLHPYRPCGWCEGSGNNVGSSRKRWGDCRRCGGSGKRERLGTRLFFRKH